MNQIVSTWTVEECKVLSDLASTHTSAEIAKILNRSQQAVFKKAKVIGAKLRSRGTSHFNGQRAESHALKILKGATWVSGSNCHAPYDLELNGFKINVKSSLPMKDRDRMRWVFKIGDSHRDCDLFLFMGYERDAALPVKVWLVPSSECKVLSIKITPNSKHSNKLRNYEIGVDVL